MSRSSSARAAHLHAESAALDVVNARLDSLQRERDEVEEALRRAQQRANDLLTQHALLKKRQKSLRGSVRTARAAYTQEFLDTCPEEILRSIFEAVVNLPDPHWCTFGDGYYNDLRAEDPFVLSAVCARWRRVALRCPRIWTYVGLPPPESMVGHPARVDLLLSRSGNCSLDILIGANWGDCDDAGATAALQECITKISLHSARWRMVELWLPPSSTRQSLADALKGPLPLLTHLSLGAAKSSGLPSLAVTQQGEGYLPFAPLLKYLEIAAPGLDVAETYHSGLPSLVSLRIWGQCSADNAARLIRLGQSTLSRFDLCGIHGTASFPVRLPNLETLHLKHDFSAWPDPAQLLPRLSKLIVDCGMVSDAATTPLQGVSPTVTYLGLYGPVTSEAINILQALSNITHLAFVAHIPSYDDDDCCTLHENIFALIAGANPVIWPRLTSITVYQDAIAMPGTLEGVLRLIKKRNVRADRIPAVPATTEEQPVCLSEVVLDCKQAPAWLKAEVARLLS